MTDAKTRGRTVTIVAVILVALTLAFWLGANFAHVRSASAAYFSIHERHLHLLLPATGANNQFCKLLLSSGIVGFPEPVLVGWEGHGIYNGTTSHLFKISETLAYLRNLPSEQDDDLVLLLDAYDIWLQMPPDVIISRYFQVLETQNQRLKQWGYYNAKAHGVNVRNSVLFGADKLCWPQSSSSPACWAVPDSTMDANVFGPETDTGMYKNRPRWLNSGTIMGPVKDVRDIFSATMDMVSRRFDPSFMHHGSDQYYFGEVWAEQELSRQVLKNGNVTGIPAGGEVPTMPTHRRTEFGISLDWGSDLFMLNGLNDHAITWMRYNHSTPAALASQSQLSRRIDQWVLADDLLRAPAPFSAADEHPGDLPTHFGWEDVMLGTNTVRGQAFPLLHVTGDKAYRDHWWPRLWFHPHGEALLEARKRQQTLATEPDVFAVVNGVKWKSTPPPTIYGWDRVANTAAHAKGGVWTDRGKFIPFEELCYPYKESLYVNGVVQQ